MPIADPAVNEKKAAEQFYKSLKTMNDETVPTMAKDLDTLKEQIKAFEGVDIKKVLALVDKMSAGYDQIRKNIQRNSKINIPGLEDETDKFSLVRAMLAVRTKKWEKAGFENEVFKNAREAVAKAGQVVGIDSQGGYFVPDQVLPDVIGAIYTQSAFIGLEDSGKTRVSLLDGLTGIPARIPKFDGGMIGYWIGEERAYLEAFSKVGNVSLTPKKLGVLARLTDEMQRFSGYGFENLMRNDMSRAAAKLLDYAVPYGTGGDDQPKGIMKYALATEPNTNQSIINTDVSNPSAVKAWSAETNSLTYNNPVAGGVLNFDGIQNMVGALEDDNIEPNASFSIIAAPRYFRQLKQLKVQFYANQTTNQAYLLGIPMLTNDRLTDILGYDWGTSTQIPNTNTAGQSLNLTPTNGASQIFGDVFMGNFSEVVVGRWSGIEIVDDGGTGAGFISDQTYVKLRMYVDVGLRQPRALIVCADAQMH